MLNPMRRSSRGSRRMMSVQYGDYPFFYLGQCNWDFSQLVSILRVELVLITLNSLDRSTHPCATNHRDAGHLITPKFWILGQLSCRILACLILSGSPSIRGQSYLRSQEFLPNHPRIQQFLLHLGSPRPHRPRPL